ncbi:uncharacterized protein LOC143207594 [Lasioglossum baleicum]|uniref:uncharacterized protein LOC143207594 n=1 Tax=Lasioglossum baleicum TaxID=434251 RepID=UPI003FCEBBEC
MWLRVIAVFALIVSSVSPKTLDLEGRGLTKEDFFLQFQKSINVAEVTGLILRNNKFDKFLDCSTNLSSVTFLDISQNHLEQFFFLCKDEYNLKVLNVSHNKLQYITHEALNHRIPKLEVLDLSSNLLSFVNETMLEYFEVLTYLSLANNPMSDGIHENAFWNLKELQYLNLSNVSLSYASAEMFKTLDKLKMLDLSRNPIKTIPMLPIAIEELDLSNTMITQLKNIKLSSLRALKLNDMQSLQELSFDDLSNLTKLETLSLTGSKKLMHLNTHVYIERPLPQLTQLSVNNCSLKTLNHNFLWITQRMRVLNLEGNPWSCDCRMNWIRMEATTKALSRDIKCYSPERHRDKRLSEVPEYEFECESESSVFYPVLWASTLLLVVAFVLAVGFFFLRRPIGAWDIGRKNRDTVKYTNVDASSTDMVRILPGGETGDRNGE